MISDCNYRRFIILIAELYLRHMDNNCIVITLLSFNLLQEMNINFITKLFYNNFE